MLVLISVKVLYSLWKSAIVMSHSFISLIIFALKVLYVVLVAVHCKDDEDVYG